jgi:hypothetical protein
VVGATCPMCRRPVSAGGDLIHPQCDPGLADAGGAIARLLYERLEQALCADCIADALELTVMEAEAAAIRLRARAGFGMRFDRCVGCGRRRLVLRALRTLREAAGEWPRSAGGAQ